MSYCTMTSMGHSRMGFGTKFKASLLWILSLIWRDWGWSMFSFWFGIRAYPLLSLVQWNHFICLTTKTGGPVGFQSSLRENIQCQCMCAILSVVQLDTDLFVLYCQ